MLGKIRTAITQNRVVSWMRRHKKITIAIVIVLIICAIIFRPQPPKPLDTVKVTKGNITQSLTASGSIQAKETVNLTFLAGGKVTYIGAQEGEMVTKGQTIATLDQRSAQKSLENATRDYAKQRNAFEQAKKDNSPNLDIASQPEDIRRVLENNQFDLEKAVASVELQDLARQNSILTSPINGILIRSDIKVAGVNAGATTTFTIANPESLVFEVDVDEADLGKIETGMQANVILEAYPDDTLHGSVQSIDFASHKTDTGGNAFTVEVELPMASLEKYRIGMNGDTDIVQDERSNVLIVPLAAIIDDDFVYVKTKDSYEKRKITLGLQSDIDAEVRSGLTEGEEITTQPDEAEKQLGIKPTE